MKSISTTLVRFAKSRERAFKLKNELNMMRAKAVTKIKRTADHISAMKPEQQLQYIPSIEQDLLQLLPNEQSRFQKIRTEIIELISLAQS